MRGFLLDTNVIVEPQRRRPDPNVLRWLSAADENMLYLSAFTFAEIRKGIAKVGQSPPMAVLEDGLSSLRARFIGRILPVDDAVLDQWATSPGAQLREDVPYLELTRSSSQLRSSIV